MLHLSSVIIGPVITEKAERQKTEGTYTLKVRASATKVDVKNALRRFYDVEVASIRVLNTLPKRRVLQNGKSMEKRHRAKHMIVRLSKKSKTLDLANFKAF